MAIIEKTGVLTYLDSNGNEIRLYPDSKSKTSDGADTVLSVLDTDWVLDETTGLYKQTFTVNGITSDSTPVIGLVPTTTPTPDAEIEAYSHIVEAVTGDSTLELYSDKALTMAIAIIVKGISAEGGSTVADITNMVAKYNELKGQYDELNNNLKFPDGTGFYPDTKDGVNGYNTSEERGADTFHPFSSVLESGISAIPATASTLTTVALKKTYNIKDAVFVIDPIMYYPGKDAKYAANRIAAFQYYLNGSQIAMASLISFDSIKISFLNTEGYFRWYVISV